MIRPQQLENVLAGLSKRLEGELLTQMHASYETARLNFLATFDDVRPLAIVMCRSPEDVARAILLARQHDLPIATRSGGHCFAGFSLCSGLVIDVTPLREIRQDGPIVSVGAGARLGDLTDELCRSGRALPSGSCPSVGVSGQTLGGGLGILGRHHGLTCDQLVSAQVVLADGQIVECDESSHPDLFWALRGAGAGGFGVVTRLTFETVTAAPMTTFYIVLPFTAAADALDHWQRWAPHAPDEIAAGLAWTAPDRLELPPAVELYGAMAADAPTVNAYLNDFLARIGSRPREDARHSLDYRQVMLHQAGLLDIAGSGVVERTPSGRDRQGFRLTRSEFIREPLPRSAIEALAATFSAERRPGEYRGLELAPFGGAYNRVGWDATAFVHRDTAYSLKHAVLVPPAAGADARRAARSWIDASYACVHGHGTGGVYPNFPDPALERPLDAYYGANLPRLTAIRSRYDPENVFDFPHAVPLIREQR